MKKDQDARDSGWREDPRYKIANREAGTGVGLALLNFFWWFGFAYGMGSRPVEEYRYILGFPDWFFYSCIIGFFVIGFLVWAVVTFLFEDVSLEDSPEEQEGGGESE
ncbi:YhdT family protein [Paludifilum halophilum]|uniref:YhdT family protein n=1 Tax=Paludifilum halophilum TaxID=1642702 RepID=UPI001F0B5149|nr:YhdT family protein [Paludifilum halophilum]